MSFKMDDIVVFEDSTKVLVLDSQLYEGKEYLFVNVLNDDESTTKTFKIYNANYQTGEFDKISNKELLANLLPLFYKRLEEYVNIAS